MYWLRTRKTKRGLELSIGPYITPIRRYIVYYLIQIIFAVVFLGTFIFLVEVYDGGHGVYRFFRAIPFIEFQWVTWMVDNPLQVAIGALIIIFILSRLAAISGILALIFLGRHRKVIFTPEAIKVRQFFFFWHTCPRRMLNSIEMKHHPRAQDADRRAASRVDRKGKPKSPMPLDNTFRQTGVVIIRYGETKLIKVATIFDLKGFGVGHKAEQLVLTLDKLVNESVAIEKRKGDYQDFYGQQP